MSAKLRPGQTAEITGPKHAMVFPNPTVVASMIMGAKRPLLVIGSKAQEIVTEDGDLIDYAIKIGKKSRLTIAVTGYLIGEFMKRKVKNVYSIPFMNLGDRLRDTGWNGFDGKGHYDLVIFAGSHYYMEWLVLSGLKNFAPNLRTISLGNQYQPNASWSIGTVNHSKWMSMIQEIIENLEEKKTEL
ncbi:CO dehydrogenase/acetyl-CoA synthase complex subunit epsilon [Thermoproteota archaeon]